MAARLVVGGFASSEEEQERASAENASSVLDRVPRVVLPKPRVEAPCHLLLGDGSGGGGGGDGRQRHHLKS